MGSTNKTGGPHLAKVRQASQNHETASYRCGHQKQCVELFPWRRKKYEDAAGYQLEVWYTGIPQVFAISKGQFTPPVGKECVFSKTHGLEKQHVYNLFGSNYKEAPLSYPSSISWICLSPPQAKRVLVPEIWS